MEVVQLQRRYIEDTASLFNDGLFDGQFTKLQQLHDESSPGFVAEVVSAFFEDSEKILNNITRAMAERTVDFNVVGAYSHQFKGSSSSIGAQQIREVCIALRRFSNEQNIEGCKRCLLQVKQEYSLVKDRLQNLLRLEQQIVEAGGAVPRLQ